jgi:hypothetical protein
MVVANTVSADRQAHHAGRDRFGFTTLLCIEPRAHNRSWYISVVGAIQTRVDEGAVTFLSRIW